MHNGKYEETELFKIIDDASKKLSKAEKAVFYYLYIEKKNINEIQEILNIKRSTITTYINKINIKLQPEKYNNEYSKDSLKDLFSDRPNVLSNTIVRFYLDLV